MLCGWVAHRKLSLTSLVMRHRQWLNHCAGSVIDETKNMKNKTSKTRPRPCFWPADGLGKPERRQQQQQLLLWHFIEDCLDVPVPEASTVAVHHTHSGIITYEPKVCLKKMSVVALWSMVHCTYLHSFNISLCWRSVDFGTSFLVRFWHGCLEQGANDLHMVQLVLLPSSSSSSSSFLWTAHQCVITHLLLTSNWL